MAKVVVTFKLEEEIYLKLKELAKGEGRGISEILREALMDWLREKSSVSPDLTTFIRREKDKGKSWAEISSLVTKMYVYLWIRAN